MPDRELGFRQLDVTSLSANPEGVLADCEDSVHRLVRTSGVDADRARSAGRGRHGRGVGIDGKRRKVDVVVDEIRLQVDFFDLIRIHHSRQQRRFAAGQPLAADAGRDRVWKPHRHYARYVVSLVTLLTANERHRRDDKTSVALRYTSPVQYGRQFLTIV